MPIARPYSLENLRKYLKITISQLLMSNKYVSQAVYQTLQTTKMNNQKTVRLTTIRLNLLQVCPSNPFFLLFAVLLIPFRHVLRRFFYVALRLVAVPAV